MAHIIRRAATWFFGGFAVLWLFGVIVGHSAQPLTDEHRESVRLTLDKATHAQLVNLIVRKDGYIVADFEIPTDMSVAARPLGEARLLAIREALLPYGYKDYRVNINGPSPGKGLVRRYGSARLTQYSELEWLTLAK